MLVYTPTLAGVKEDIVLESYTGQNVFTFMLNTGGLNLYSTNGRYYLAESKTATDRIELGDLVTFDANGRFSVGTMTSQTITAGNIYRLTLTVDEAFLTDPDTVYPVSIDPNLTYKTQYDTECIEDVNIYQGRPNLNANWTYMHVGKYDDTYGVGRILVRLTALINSSTYQEMTASQITSATFHIKEATGKAAANIELHAFKASSTWTESGATWSNVGSTFGNHIVTVSHPRSDYAEYDITELVKGWKTGESSAAAGFILCHADEEIATKGFYSAEFSTTTNRPYAIVTYISSSGFFDEHPDHVVEGESINLHISGVSAQITWTSSDTNVATVDQNGKVTGIKAGPVTITARADGYTDKTCDIWVTVPDGVYYLKNNYSGQYMSVKDSAVTSGTDLYQEAKRTSAPTSFSQLWKIKYLAEGYYSVRPMHKLSTALTVTRTTPEIITTTTDETYDSFPSSRTWKINYHSSGGYVVMYRGYDYKSLYPSGLSVSANVQVLAGTFSSATTSYLWTLEEPSTAVSNQVVFYDSTSKTLKTTATRYIAPGETLNLSALGLSASFVSEGTNAQGISWYSSNSAVTVNASNGQITGVTPGGTAYIYAKQTYNGVTYRRYYFVRVTDIAEGTYFIRNKQTDTYMQIDDDVSSYSTDGAAMELWEFDGGSYQKWTFTRLDDGYYSIKSGTSGLALSVQESYVNASGQSLVQEEYDALDRQRWKVSVTSTGSYILRPKSADNANYDTDWCMAAGAVSSGDTPVQQAAYVSDSDYKDEWSLFFSTIPLSGDELIFDTTLWNYEPVVSHTNCYAYILNNQIDPINDDFGCNAQYSYSGAHKQQPGEFYNSNLNNGETPVDIMDFRTNPDILITAAQKDFQKYNELFGTSLVFEQIDSLTSPCPEGTYKVALYVYMGTSPLNADYHWYRQDSNSIWSHKIGESPICQEDNSGILICNPDTADRGGYDILVGYFAVSPWSNLYSDEVALSLNSVPSLSAQDSVPCVSVSLFNSITQDMTIEEVINILGGPGQDIGSGTIVHKYTLSNDVFGTITYVIDTDGTFRVLQTYTGGTINE